MKSKISGHIRQNKTVSPPKVTNRAVLDPGGGNRCSPEYLSFQKAFNKVCPQSSYEIKWKVLIWYNGHLNDVGKKCRNKNLHVSRDQCWSQGYLPATVNSGIHWLQLYTVNFLAWPLACFFQPTHRCYRALGAARGSFQWSVWVWASFPGGQGSISTRCERVMPSTM